MAVYRRLPAVERHLTGGRRLVQPVDAPTATKLSGSAPVIWDLLADHEDLDELVARVQERFADPPEIVESGTRAAVAQLLESGLIEELSA